MDDEAISKLLNYAELVAVLDDAFRKGGHVPQRQQYPIELSEKSDAHLLLMPAWQSGDKIGIKVVTVFPDNGEYNLPTVNSSYLLLNANTGMLEVIMAGDELTRRRTAAASALAARYLARSDSKKLLMVGTGHMSTHLIRAHCTVNPIEVVEVWGRNSERAQHIASQFSDDNFAVTAVTDLEAAVASVDIISCATLSTEPLVFGAWLRPGQHLDLVGSFTPGMREVDDEALRSADIYLDTRGGALAEAGEIVQGIAKGVITESDVKADLYDLCSGSSPGRMDDRSITLFKSVGCALEDLAAARLTLHKSRCVSSIEWTSGN